jgi:uncharacterized protein (DUF1015 family)
MAKIYPFRGLRYAPDRIPVDKVVTQPYDKISKEMQDRYYQLHPNNIIRIILGKTSPEDSSSNNVYTRAAEHLKEWRAAGVLQQLADPAFFVYFQRFQVPGSAGPAGPTDVRVRKGFVGLGRLEDYANKVIFPHERTLSGPKKDRIELLRHTRTQFEQIFMLYEDPAQTIDRALDEVAAGPPGILVDDEYGVRHTMWFVTDPKLVSLIQQEMAEKKLIIADGHHRYETAVAFRDEMGGGPPFDRMPMTFFNMKSPGLTILPTHRVLSNLPDFDSGVMLERAQEFFEVLDSDATAGDSKPVTIGVCADQREKISYLTLKSSLDLAAAMPDLSPKQRTLDVVVLHRLVLDKCLGITEEAVTRESYITYVRERNDAIKAVKSGKAQVAFLLNPTQIDQMRDIAYEGNVMPQKSTDFYPKVLSGLVMYAMEGVV